ncbi:hypothetical protein KY289_008584 [Solanum tuberosum]|nr:hypothetical protein KY289_008584 [Solanum tuberosum]
MKKASSNVRRSQVVVPDGGAHVPWQLRRSPRRQWQEARRGDPSSPFTFVARRSSEGDAMTTKGERQEARKARKTRRPI